MEMGNILGYFVREKFSSLVTESEGISSELHVALTKSRLLTILVVELILDQR